MSTKMSAKLIAFLAILLVSAGVGLALAQQAEPDDVASGATDLGTIGAEGGMITSQASFGYPGDIDWFKFTVEAPTADLVVSSDLTKDLRLVIYDGNLSYLDSDEGLLMMTAEAGTYLVRVDSVDLEVGNYSIALSSLFESEPNDCITDGDDLGSLAGPTILGGSIDPMADIDFFLFEIAEGSEGYVTISGLASDLYEDYEAYEEYEDDDDYEDYEDYEFIFEDIFEDVFTYSDTISLVLYGYDETEGRYLPIDYSDYEIEADLTSGSYAVRVESESLDPIAGYVLAITFSSFECDAEPNDDPGDAQDLGTLTGGAALTEGGCILPGDDLDYYVFKLNESMDVVLETSGDSDGDSYIYLYDEELEEIDYDDDNGERSWSKIERVMVPGTYYVEIASYLSGETFQYALTVTGTKVEAEGEES